MVDTTGDLTKVFGSGQAGGRKVTAKALRRALKKAGLKTTGKKAALTRRAKKAHLKMGGAKDPLTGEDVPEGGRRRRGGVECGPGEHLEGDVCVPDTPPEGGRRRRGRKSRGTRRH